MKEKETKVYKERKKKAQFFTPTQLVDRILQEAEIPFENKTILEPSCGDGVFIEQLIENNEIYAIDKDKNKTKAIKEKYQTAKVITKDFLQYNPKIKFDVVIGNVSNRFSGEMPRRRPRTNALTTRGQFIVVAASSMIDEGRLPGKFPICINTSSRSSSASEAKQSSTQASKTFSLNGSAKQVGSFAFETLFIRSITECES